MKKLLAILLLTSLSISIGANADENNVAVELTEQFVYQDNEIDFTALNNEVLANLEFERGQYQIQIDFELEKQLQSLFNE